MAAGASRRLQPLTDTIPKTLLKLGEKTILARILDTAREQSLTHFDIVTGHGHPAVEEFAAEYQTAHPDININLIYNDQYDSTGNIVSLQYANQAFDEDFLIVNSDTIFHADILKRLLDSNHPNAMVVDNVSQLGEEEMKVLTDDKEAITHIHKSLDPDSATGEYIGIMKLSKDVKQKLLNSLDQTINKDNSLYYEDALQHLITDNGITIHPVYTDSLPSMEIDTPEDLDDAGKLILEM